MLIYYFDLEIIRMGSSLSTERDDSGDIGFTTYKYDTSLTGNCAVASRIVLNAEEVLDFCTSLPALPTTTIFLFIFEVDNPNVINLPSTSPFSLYILSTEKDKSLVLVGSNVLSADKNKIIFKRDFGDSPSAKILLHKPTGREFYDVFLDENGFNIFSGLKHTVNARPIFRGMKTLSTVSIAPRNTININSKALDTSNFYVYHNAVSGLDNLFDHIHTITARGNVCGIYNLSRMSSEQKEYVNLYLQHANVKIHKYSNYIVVRAADVSTGGVVKYCGTLLSLNNNTLEHFTIEIFNSRERMRVNKMMNGVLADYVGVSDAIRLITTQDMFVESRSIKYDLAFIEITSSRAGFLVEFLNMKNFEKKYVLYVKMPLSQDVVDAAKKKGFSVLMLTEVYTVITNGRHIGSGYYKLFDDRSFSLYIGKGNTTSVNADWIVSDVGLEASFDIVAIRKQVLDCKEFYLDVPQTLSPTNPKDQCLFFYSSDAERSQIRQHMQNLQILGYEFIVYVGKKANTTPMKNIQIDGVFGDLMVYSTEKVLVKATDTQKKLKIEVSFGTKREFTIAVYHMNEQKKIGIDLALYPNYPKSVNLEEGINLNNKLAYIGGGVDFGELETRDNFTRKWTSAFWIAAEKIDTVKVKAELLQSAIRYPHVILIRVIEDLSALAYIKCMDELFKQNPNILIVTLLVVNSLKFSNKTFKTITIDRSTIVVCKSPNNDDITLTEGNLTNGVILSVAFKNFIQDYELVNEVAESGKKLQQGLYRTFDHNENFNVPLDGYVDMIESSIPFLLQSHAGTTVRICKESCMKKHTFSLFSGNFPTINYFKGNYKNVLDFVTSLENTHIRNRSWALILYLDEPGINIVNLMSQMLLRIEKQKVVNSAMYKQKLKTGLYAISNLVISYFADQFTFGGYIAIQIGDTGSKQSMKLLLETGQVVNKLRHIIEDGTIDFGGKSILRMIKLLPDVQDIRIDGPLCRFFKNIVSVVFLPDMQNHEVYALSRILDASPNAQNVVLVVRLNAIFNSGDQLNSLKSSGRIVTIFNSTVKTVMLQDKEKYVHIEVRNKADDYYFKFGISCEPSATRFDSNFVHNENIDFLVNMYHGDDISPFFKVIYNERTNIGSNFLTFQNINREKTPTVFDHIETGGKSMLFLREFISVDNDNRRLDLTGSIALLWRKSSSSSIHDSPWEIMYSMANLKKEKPIGVIFIQGRNVDLPDVSITLEMDNRTISSDDYYADEYKVFYPKPQIVDGAGISFVKNSIVFESSNQLSTSKSVFLSREIENLKIGTGIRNLRTSIKYGNGNYDLILLAPTI